MTIKEVFGTEKPLIGMIHLNGDTHENIFEQAKAEIEQMYLNGMDAVMVEDYFGTPQDAELALQWLNSQYPHMPYGVNILRSDEKGFELAKKYGVSFMQIDSVCGHLEPYDDLKYAGKLAKLRDDSLFLIGGVRFKYQDYLSGRPLDVDLELGMQRCDGIVVTGSATGEETDMEKILQFRSILGDFPLIVGAGLTIDNCAEQLSIADGAIVGTWIKKDGMTGNPVDPERVKKLVEKVKALR